MSRLLKKFFTRLSTASFDAGSLPIEGVMPELTRLTGWFNSEPLTRENLSGKVVLIDFWTLSCVNCIRTIPYLNHWHQSYQNNGLIIIGVHTPEFSFEVKRENVESAIRQLGISYPIATDDNRALWNAFENRYWPAHYFIDRHGNIRYRHFGEGNYRHSELILRALLSENGIDLPEMTTPRIESTVQFDKIHTPETYLGFERMESLGSPEKIRRGEVIAFTDVPKPANNIFYLNGFWEIQTEYAISRKAGAGLTFPYTASVVNLVMESNDNEPIIAEVTLDGKPLTQKNAGADIRIEGGISTVKTREGRMYQLINTRGNYDKHVLRLRFPEQGIRLYAFTFG